MSIELPPALAWVASLAVGEQWPQGDEDKLAELAAVWEGAARELMAISNEVGPSVTGVLESMAGPAVAEFREFVEKFLQNLPKMAEGLQQLGTLARRTATEIQYAKYMILTQLVWMAFEIGQWMLFAPQVIPVIVTAGRLAVRMIVRRMLMSIAMGIGLMVGMDVALQTLQMMMGDRTQWNSKNTLAMLGSGAIGGAIGGLTFGLGDEFMPKFASSLLGKLAIGAGTGVATTFAQDAAMGGHSGIVSAFTSGAMEAFSGGGRRFRWQKPEGAQVKVDLDLSVAPNLDIPGPPAGGAGVLKPPGGDGKFTASDGPGQVMNTLPGSEGGSGSPGDAPVGQTPVPQGTTGPGPSPAAAASQGAGTGPSTGSRGDDSGVGGPAPQQGRQDQQGQEDGRRLRAAARPGSDEEAGGVPGTVAPPSGQGLPGFETTLVDSGSDAGTTAPASDGGTAPAPAPAAPGTAVPGTAGQGSAVPGTAGQGTSPSAATATTGSRRADGTPELARTPATGTTAPQGRDPRGQARDGGVPTESAAGPASQGTRPPTDSDCPGRRSPDAAAAPVRQDSLVGMPRTAGQQVTTQDAPTTSGTGATTPSTDTPGARVSGTGGTTSASGGVATPSRTGVAASGSDASASGSDRRTSGTGTSTSGTGTTASGSAASASGIPTSGTDATTSGTGAAVSGTSGTGATAGTGRTDGVVQGPAGSSGPAVRAVRDEITGGGARGGDGDRSAGGGQAQDSAEPESVPGGDPVADERIDLPDVPPEHGGSPAQTQTQESASVRESGESGPQTPAQERAASVEGPVRVPKEVLEPTVPPSHVQAGADVPAPQREQPQVQESRPGPVTSARPDPVGETTGAPLEQADGTHPATEAVEQSAHEVPQDAAAHGGRVGEEVQGGGGLASDAELRRFVEQRFVTLEEQEARRLWAEASRITAEHNPFNLTIGRPGEGLREHDPGQYWATMRVAQTLHQYRVDWATMRVAQTLPQHAVDQAVAMAQALAAERGVGAVRDGLRGGGNPDPVVHDHPLTADFPATGDREAPGGPHATAVVGGADEPRHSGPTPEPAVTRHVTFAGGSSRVSDSMRREIDALAARAAEEGVAAHASGRQLPTVTITSHGNGMRLGQPHFGRAMRSGQERADAVAAVFRGRLDAHLVLAEARGAAVPRASDFPVAATSRGREYPVGTRPKDGPAARRRAVISISHPSRAVVPETTEQAPGTKSLAELFAESPLPSRHESPTKEDWSAGAVPPVSQAGPDGSAVSSTALTAAPAKDKLYSPMTSSTRPAPTSGSGSSGSPESSLSPGEPPVHHTSQGPSADDEPGARSDDVAVAEAQADTRFDGLPGGVTAKDAVTPWNVTELSSTGAGSIRPEPVSRQADSPNVSENSGPAVRSEATVPGGQAVLNEGMAGARRPADGAVDLSDARGAAELRELTDALGRPEVPLRVSQVERVVAEVRDGLREAGVEPAVVHGTVLALREAALERLEEGARRALDAYLSGHADDGLGRFSVDPAWGDGHRVVDDLTKLGHEFDAARDVVMRDLRLFDAPEELAELWVVERPGEGTFHLAGDPELVRRFGIAPADAELAERAGALFQVIDLEQGHRYHFTRGGLSHTDRRLEASLGYLRLDAGDVDGTPRLLNAEGVPVTEGVWRLEPAGGERVALIPAQDHRDPERPLERLEVDARTGRVVAEAIGAPDVRGRLLREYWRIDHEAGTARRLDARGTPLTGPYETAVVSSNSDDGITLTSDPGGRVLFRHPDPGDAMAAGARESGAEPAGSELPLSAEGLGGPLSGTRVHIERGPDGAVVRTLVGHGWGTGFMYRAEALPKSLAGVLGDGFTIVNQVTGEALHFDAARHLQAVTREQALGGEGLPARLSGLKVERIRISATDVTSAVDVVRLVGAPALTDSFTVAWLEGEMAPRLPDGFSVTDTVTGDTLYFDADARFAFRRTERGSDAAGTPVHYALDGTPVSARPASPPQRGAAAADELGGAGRETGDAAVPEPVVPGADGGRLPERPAGRPEHGTVLRTFTDPATTPTPAPDTRRAGTGDGGTRPTARPGSPNDSGNLSGTADSGGSTTASDLIRQDITFTGGSRRLSDENLRDIDMLARQVAREALANMEADRPLPTITINGHSNGTVLGQPHFGRAMRSGQERADAVVTAFTTRLDAHLRAAQTGWPTPLRAWDFPVTAQSRGREFPPGTYPDQGPSARRRTVIIIDLHRRPTVPVTRSHPTPHADVTPRTDRPTRADLFARADNDLSANDSRKPEAPKPTDAATRPAGGFASEAPSEAERPWYFDRDALGEVSVVEADALHVGLASQWANRTVYEVTRPGDSEQLTTAIREGIRGLLMSATKPGAGHEARAGHTADAEQRVAFWENALQRGHLILAGDHVVWLRPVLRRTSPIPVEPIPDLVKYKVGYGRLTTDVSFETAKSSGVGSLMQMVLSTASDASSASTVMPMPVVSADASQLRGTELGRDMTAGRKVFATEHTQFRGGVHVLVFVDGVERPHAVVTPEQITVEIPAKFSAPGGPRPDGPGLPNGREVIGHRSHHAREVVNAIDLIPVTAALQRHLRESGLPAHGVRKVMSDVLSRLNERSVRNRSRYWLTNGVVSDRTQFSTELGRFFEGHVFMHAEIERLEYLGDTPGVAVREDTSGNTTASRTQGVRSRATVGLTFFSTSVLRKVALMPTAELKFRPRRDTRHGLSEGSETHTVLTATSDQARYRARLRMTVEVRSTTHRIPEFRHPVEAEIGVPARESADFERRLLGGDAPPLRQALLSLDGPVEAQPHVRSLLREASLALSESADRRPARLDRPLPPPHPREPLALAIRRGAGFAAEMALPGAELVHDQIRGALEVWHNRLSGKAKADWSGTDHELLTWFARPALEIDLPRLLSGVHHTVRLGGRSYAVSVRAHLLNRIGGVTGSDAYPMKVNLRSQQIVKVKGRRDMRWNLRGALGFRVGIEVRPWALLRLGLLHGSAGFGRDVRYALSGGTKSYQRTQAAGPVDEHVYDVVYEVSVRPPGHAAERWWIDKPGDVVARVVVPHQHVPATPLSTSELAVAGTVSRPAARPDGPAADFRNGTAGLFPAFLTTPELPETAARMYQKANNLPADWIEDRANWPAELAAITDPLHLSADLAVLTSRTGKVVELPAGTDGWKQVLRLRMTGYEPRHVAAHSGEGRTVEVQHYAQGHEYIKRSARNLSEAGLNAMVGLQFRLGSAQGSGAGAWNSAGAGGDEHSGEVHAQINVAASGELLWERVRSSTTEEGPVGNSRAAYNGTVHTYRVDPVFEITLDRWKNAGLTSLGRGMTRRTEYLRVTDGMDFLVPERRITDLGLPVPEGMEEVQPHKPVGYVDAAVLPSVSHPEILHADPVLDRMKQWLTDQGILHLHPADGGSHGQRPENRPSLLLRELERSFSSEALLSQFSMLSGAGVTRWLPLPWAFGATRYLWTNVTAEIGPPVSQLNRPEVRLMQRAHTHRETAKEAATHRTAELSAQLLARIGTSRHGGPGLGGGYTRTTGKGSEQVEREMDIHRAITEKGSQEFEHPLKFRIRMGITMEAPEILSVLARRIRTGVLGAAGLLGHRRDVAGWWYQNQPFVKRFPSSEHPGEGIVDGVVRLLVPDHLVIPGTPPAPAPASVGTAAWDPDTAVQDAPASRTDRELLERLLEDGHPWALPAAAAAHRWAALPAAPFRPPHDLTAPHAWHVPGLDFTTLDGLQYRLFTSENLMRANIGRLLRHQYEVRVGGRTVTVGLDITRIKTLGPEGGISFTARHHQLAEEASTDTFEQTRGWQWEAGPDVGGEARHGLTILEHVPVTWGLASTEERRGGTAEVEEPDQDRSQLYRHYRADVDLVVRGPRGRLCVHVPDGLYFMLPVDHSYVPFQNGAAR